MKKLLILIPLIVFSCQKKETETSNFSQKDSLILPTKTEVKDSVSAIPTIETDRVFDGDSIIRNVKSEQIPFRVDEEFTHENQQLIIKIQNFDRQNISGEILPENPEMNIRFNQIKLPNGDYDGPFGRRMMFKSRENGEIWLIIGKSNMASGTATGKFSIKIQ